MSNSKAISNLAKYFPDETEHHLSTVYEKCNHDLSTTICTIENQTSNHTWGHLFGQFFTYFKQLFGFGNHLEASPPEEDLRSEGFFEIAINKNLIAILQEKFGESTFLPGGFSTVIEIPLSVGRQLYAAYIESIYKQEEISALDLTVLKQETEDFERRLKEEQIGFIDEDWNSVSVELLDVLDEDYTTDWVDGPQTSRIYREVAQNHKKMAHMLFQKARDCHSLKIFNHVYKYIDKAKEEMQLAEEANRQAVETILKENSRGLPRNCIDLHYLHVSEAVKVLDQFLDRNILLLEEENLDVKQLMIITGRGKHSPGGIPKIKPAVCERLKQRALKFSETNPGTLKAKIYQQSFLIDEL